MRKCFDLNSREALMITSAERLDHLQVAAEHLAAAGCEKEAACVHAWATEMKQDLAAHMREMSEQLKVAAGELEEELKTACAASEPAVECQSAASGCPNPVSAKPACSKNSNCQAATEKVAAAPVKCAEKTCDSRSACGTDLQVIEVSLTSLRELGLEFPGCAQTDGDADEATSIQLIDRDELTAKLTELRRNHLAKEIELPRTTNLDGKSFRVRHPELGSHIKVRTQPLGNGRVRIDISPCHSADDQPADEYVARAQEIYEVDAHFEMGCGEIAVVGGRVQKRVRVERRMGLTSSQTIQKMNHVQPLFIVTPSAAEATSIVQQVSHTEPAACNGTVSCPTACEKKASASTCDEPCEQSACNRAVDCSSSTCPTATVACDAAHATACHAASGIAQATCPIATACDVLTACDAAGACVTKCCEAKSCDSLPAAESSDCSLLGSFASQVGCEATGECLAAESFRAAVNCNVVSSCPSLTVDAEAIATDAGECCTRDKCCLQACTDAAVAAADLGAENAPCALASDEGCAEVISCDAAAHHPLEFVATGSYSAEQLANLAKAAEHLTVAGLTEEAASVQTIANKLRQELIAANLAQIASLQAEVEELQHACEATCEKVSIDCEATVQPQADIISAPATDVDSQHSATTPQIALKVKVFQVSLTNVKKLGFGLATPLPGGAMTPNQSGFTPFLDALVRENVAKVLAEATLVLGDRRPGSMLNGGNVPSPVLRKDKSVEIKQIEFGTCINACAALPEDNRVRIDIRPRITELCPALGQVALGINVPGLIVHEVDTGFESELGQTTVIGGDVQQRMVKEKDPHTLVDRTVRNDVQTIFLVTPHLVGSEPTVTPVNQVEFERRTPSIRPFRATTHRTHDALQLQTDPSQPLPKITFSK